MADCVDGDFRHTGSLLIATFRQGSSKPTISLYVNVAGCETEKMPIDSRFDHVYVIFKHHWDELY
jgi:hypothetical protein